MSIKKLSSESRKEFISIIPDGADHTEKEHIKLLLEDAIIWRTLIEHSRDGIVVLDENGKVFEANQRFADMLGYSSEEVLQLHVWDWDVQWTQDHLLEMHRTINQKGDHFETLHRCKDGTLLNVDISTNGEVIGGKKLVFCVCRDISDLKRTQKELRETEEHFRILVEGAPDAIFVGTEGRFSYLNNKACNLLGAESSYQLLGQPILDRIHPSFRDMVKERIRILYEDKESVPLAEEVYIRLDGSEVPVEISSVPILYDGKNGGLVFVRDITERKLVEERKRKIAKRMSEINQCVLSLGPSFGDNVKKLTELCGKMLDATCAIYNRLDSGMLCSIGQWHTPSDYDPKDKPDGHICYDVIQRGGIDIFIVRDLHKTNYAKTDPNVRKYSLRTYVGCPVKCNNEFVGSICVVYQKDVEPTEEDKRVLGTIASVLSMEEEYRRSSEAINESENKYRSLFNQSVEGIYVHDLNGNILDVNRVAVLQSGYSREELLQLNVLDLLIDEMHRDDIIYQWRQWPLEKPVVIETEHRHKDGTVYPVKVTTGKVKIGNRELIQALVRDITEQRMVEKEIRDSRERLSLAMKASSIGFWDMDLDTHEIYFSPEIYSMCGYGADEISNTVETLMDLSHPDDREAFFNAFNRSICDFVPFDIDLRMRHKKGGWVWVSMKGKPIDIDKNGRAHRIIGTQVDITHRMAAQESLLYAKAAADEFSRVKSELLHNVSHELRTPLNAVIGYSEILLDKEREDLSESQSKYLGYINQSGKNLLKIIERMLDFADLEQCNFDSLEIENVNVNELILEILNMFSVKAHKENITITKIIDQDLKNIVVDKQKIKNTLFNLVENALKFTESGGSVKIEVKKMGDYAHFLVHDTGVGISKEKLDLIFEPFMQIDGTLSRKYGGTGLGLPVAKKLVELHGGSLWVNSKLGKGSTFVFAIPLAKGA